MPITIPLQLNEGKLDKTVDEKESIEQFLKLLIYSHLGSFVADREFGFSLMNHRFDVIDTNVNTFWERFTIPADVKKEIKGDSDNDNTFANDLKKSIEKYEHRLKEVSVENPIITFENNKMKTIFNIKGKLNGECIPFDIETFFW